MTRLKQTFSRDSQSGLLTSVMPNGTKLYARSNLNFIARYLKDALVDPSFPSETVERERNRILTEFLEYEENAQARVNDRLHSNTLRVNGLSTNTLGPEEAVEAITYDDLIEAHRRAFSGSNIEIAVTSNLMPLFVTTTLSKAVEGLPKGTQIKTDEISYHADTTVTLDEPEARSANFCVVLNAGKLDPDEMFQLKVITEIFNNYVYSEMLNKGVVYHCEARYIVDDDNVGIMFVGKARADSVHAISPAIIDTLEKFQSGVSTYRYNTAKDNAVREAAGKVDIHRMLYELENFDQLKTFRTYSARIDELLSPQALLDFVITKILSQPPSIGINGGENTRQLTETLPQAMQELGQKMQGAKFVPAQNGSQGLVNRITGLVLGRK